jgi:acyl carrier protein
LGVERVGIHDNFFDVGGHSLLATQVISRIRDAFHVEIPLRQIFERPVMAALADAIVQAQTDQANEAEIAQILAELGDISEEDAQAILITEADEMTNYDAS